MSNEGIPDTAFFSWLDEHIEQAQKLVDLEAVAGSDLTSAFAIVRLNTLREVRAYFGDAS